MPLQGTIRGLQRCCRKPAGEWLGTGRGWGSATREQSANAFLVPRKTSRSPTRVVFPAWRSPSPVFPNRGLPSPETEPGTGGVLTLDSGYSLPPGTNASWELLCSLCSCFRRAQLLWHQLPCQPPFKSIGRPSSQCTPHPRSSWNGCVCVCV